MDISTWLNGGRPRERSLDLRAYRQWKTLRDRLWQSRPAGAVVRTVFVTGTPRSGTNMVMNMLERSPQTEVVHETDPRAYERFRLRGDDIVARLRGQCRTEVLTVKCLMEGHRLREMLDRFAPAMAIWMCRHFDDMIRSHMRSFPNNREYLEQILEDRSAAKFRGLGMTDPTLATLKEMYRPGLNHASAIALFWYYRTQLFFDQGLEADPRALIVDYDGLCTDPARLVPEIARRLGIAYRPGMSGFISARSVQKRPLPEIEPHIRALCEAMYDRVIAVALRPR